MKLFHVLVFVLESALAAQALLIPEDVRALSLSESTPIEQRELLYNELERRKGGGGGGKGGGGEGGGSSSGGSSSSGGKGGSGSSSGSGISYGLAIARGSC